MYDLKKILEYCSPWDNDYQFYSFENEDEKQAFKKWFIDNAEHYSIDKQYKFEPKILSEMIPGGCYGNGQYISSILNIGYVEGLVLPNGRYVFDEYIPHGFNIINGKVIDYSYKKITEENPYHLPEMPTEYWGIEIPSEYLSINNSDKTKKPSVFHRPLLLQYWRDSVKIKGYFPKKCV